MNDPTGERSHWLSYSHLIMLGGRLSILKRVKKSKSIAYQILSSILSDSDALNYLGVNRYQDVLWFNKEAFEDLMWWLIYHRGVEIS